MQEEKGKTEDEMVGWHHQLNRHEFEQALGAGDGQGSLVCCSPCGYKELGTTQWLNWTEWGCRYRQWLRYSIWTSENCAECFSGLSALRAGGWSVNLWASINQWLRVTPGVSTHLHSFDSLPLNPPVQGKISGAFSFLSAFAPDFLIHSWIYLVLDFLSLPAVSRPCFCPFFCCQMASSVFTFAFTQTL